MFTVYMKDKTGKIQQVECEHHHELQRILKANRDKLFQVFYTGSSVALGEKFLRGLAKAAV